MNYFISRRQNYQTARDVIERINITASTVGTLTAESSRRMRLYHTGF